MPAEIPQTNLQMRSTIKADATLELSLAEAELPEIGEGEALLRVGYRTFKLPSGTTSESGRYVKSLGDPVAGRG